MDYVRYLQRIKFSERARADVETLKRLHQQHVISVPFENLDIHYKRRFDLEEESIFKKVVENSRGGFCYELNYLFNKLLNAIGFSSHIISARVYDSSGVPGPEFDHMSVLVKMDKQYLADVGFGDLFLQPLEIKAGVQGDGRSQFLIEQDNARDYTLLMSSDGEDFQKKYVFSLNEVTLDPFREPCLDKQINPDSYFVKNTICTRATDSGRITIYNDRVIRREGPERVEKQILSDVDLRVQLRKLFDIEII